ncbi:MAG: SpoIIE family protein phosphatase [Oscillospiraceae bacterium]|jgi:stage II sporulation protein E|nr:SpoIIE family protein phosphatase [Oscillospiraceae bacterium]
MMDVKGTKEKLIGRLGAEMTRRAAGAMSRPRMAAAGQLAMRFGGGFLLSRAVVLDGMAPFGAGWVAASGGGAQGLAALLGAMTGVITASGQMQALKTIAILILVYTAGVLFRGTAPARHAIFLPAVGGAVAAFVGMVIVAGAGFGVRNVIFYITEILLVTGSGYFYTLASDRSREERGMRGAFSRLALRSTLLLSVADVALFGTVRPARVAAAVITLRAAYLSGAGMGSATGLAAGSAMDLALGYPFFSMSYGISGLLSGVFRKAGKFAAAVTYVLAGAVTVLWAGTAQLRLAALLETFMASVAFMLLPAVAGRRVRAAEDLEDRGARDTESGRRTREFARRRLEQSALAFQEVYTQLQTVFKRPQNDEDVARVFDRTAERVCRRCAMRGQCWDREMENTYNVLGGVSGVLNREGKVRGTDFPPYFSTRCIQFSKFVHTANEEMAALLSRRKYRAGLSESRAQVCLQYAEMAKTLGHIAEQVGAEVCFDEEAEARIRKALEPYRLPLAVTALSTPEGQKRVEIEGRGAGLLLSRDRGDFLRGLGQCVGYTVSMPEQVVTPLGEKLIFTEAERLRAAIGVASHKKQGESVSGDYGTWFKTADGNAHIILSDGMGSGREAGEQSEKVVALLERFLRAGIDPPSALSTINSTLVLRGAEGCESLVTVDLCVCNLKTGHTRFFKNGASPSYIKRGSRVSRVMGQGWPIGIGLTPAPGSGVTAVKLTAGDLIVMASDGVCGTGGDRWLAKLLEAGGEWRPKELAGRILEQAVLQSGRGDDMMVMVFALSE